MNGYAKGFEETRSKFLTSIRAKAELEGYAQARMDLAGITVQASENVRQ
jgi:hypothetical protein